MDVRVSLERLDVDNYATWSVRMRFTLISRGLWKHVINDGKVTDTDGDQKALALIGLSVMDHHLPSLGQRETAKDAWDALESVYKAKSMARRVALKREMNSLKKAAEEPMTKYVARAKELRDQLAAAGLVTDDEEVAAALLAGLPPDYDVIVAVLETTADKVDLDVLLGKLLTAEQRLPKANEPAAPLAYAGTAERAARGGGIRPPLRCFYCNQLGHIVRDCPKASANRARGAYQAAGDDWRGVAMTAVKYVEAGGWVLDSGASHHITNDASTMSDMRPLDDAIHITFANGEQAEARGIGSVQLGGLTGAAFDYITLKDVLYVPEACVNLVSIPLAVRRGIVFDFAEEGCRVSRGRQLVTIVPPSGGVYVIAPSPGVAAALSAKATPQLWHRHYGNMGYQPNSKGYRILTNDGKVIVAGDVAIDKTKGGAQRPGAVKVAPTEHVRVAVDSDGGGSSGEDNGAVADGDCDDSASDSGDPTSMAEALAADDAQHWQQAMDDEIASLAANDTWTLEEAPPGVRARTIKLDQKTMAAQLVSKCGLDDGKPRGILLSKSIELRCNTGEALDKDVYAYTNLVGSMLYMSVCTRPDIAQAVGALSKFMAAPTTTQRQAAIGVLRYLTGSKGFGITHGASAETIVDTVDIFADNQTPSSS